MQSNLAGKFGVDYEEQDELLQMEHRND